MKKQLKTPILLSAIFIIFLVFTGASSAKVYDFTEDNKLTLLQEARAAVDLKLDLVRNAKHHIHIMTYYWDKNTYPRELTAELRKAHARGVDVRIITTYLPTIAMDFWGKIKKQLYAGIRDNDEDKDKDKETNAILAFMRYSPKGPRSLTNNLHEKIFLVDGEVAILGGRNVSDSSFQAKDIEVKIEGPIVNQIQTHFQKMFSFMVDLKIKSKCGKEKIECHKNFNKWKFLTGDKRFFPEQLHYDNGVRARILSNEVILQLYNHVGNNDVQLKDDIIDTVTQTKFSKLRGYNYFILPTENYKNFLESNLAEGKDIQIITNGLATSAFISDKGYFTGLPEMYNLVKKGLSLHQWLGQEKVGHDQLSYLHEKVMLFDDDHGIIGSHNFGVGSSTVSSEISIEFYSRPIVQTLIDVFEKEFNDTQTTKVATLDMLEKEMRDNKKILHLLHFDFIGRIIEEIY